MSHTRANILMLIASLIWSVYSDALVPGLEEYLNIYEKSKLTLLTRQINIALPNI